MQSIFAQTTTLYMPERTGSMRPLAFQLASRLYGGRNSGHLRGRTYSTFRAKEELSLEDEAERKVGWFLKLLFAGTAAAVGYQFFPYMGDNLMQQSISLLHVKDPLFKRMGASRLARFAIDDDRRMKIVNMGGGQELLKMLEGARDDRTRKEALKALAALSTSDEAIRVLHSARLESVVKSIPDSSLEADIQKYRSGILKRCQDLRYDTA